MAAKCTSAGEYANSLLNLIFTATAYPSMAQNATSAPFSSLYISLHTANPGAGGNQGTTEAAYPSYSRIAVTRTSGGWTVSSNTVVPAATIIFPASTGSPSETETYFGIGTSSAGAGHLLYYGTVTPNIVVTSAGVTPELTTGSTISET